MFEDINIEYKEQYSDSIKKEVVAFANTKGGKIYIGISDDKKIVGVSNVDETMLQITNSIRDAISPDISLFTSCEIEKVKGKNILVLIVQKGTNPPYYIKKKGIRPEGVYIRQGASSVPASDVRILKMIHENVGNDYEQTRSLEQDLNFDDLVEEFKKSDLTIERHNMKTLGLVGEDDLYTNLALLLSEACPHTVKIAVFEGFTKNIFKDRYEVQGSLFSQLNQIYKIVNRYNRTTATIEGLKRVDTREYPEIAIREVILNLIVHRDYSYSGSAFINIYDDRMEFVSIGGLVKGITKEDIMLGVSISRNQYLANIFYRLRYIEAYGTGIGKIMDCYEKESVKPSIEVTNNAFKVILPNLLVGTWGQNIMSRELESLESKSRLTANELLIARLVKEKNVITRKEVEEKLGLSQAGAINIINKLMDKKILIKEGKGRNTYYRIR